MSPTETGGGALTGSGGTELRFLRWVPSGARGRVLVIHGLGEHAGRFQLLAEALARRGYSVLAYDQRGHGESGGRRGHVASFELFLEDLSIVHQDIDRWLPGPGLPFLYAHSMGALVLIRYLQTRRPRVPGVVLSAPWLATLVAIPWWKDLLAKVLRRTAPGFPIRTGMDAGALTRDPEQQLGYAEDPLIGRTLSVGMYDGVREAQACALADAVPTAPVLLLLPGEDPLADSDVTTRWCGSGEDVEVIRLAGFRHEPHTEVGREEVFERVADWLDAHTRTGG